MCHAHNKHKYPDKYAYDLLLLFHPFHKKSLLQIKKNIEPYCDLANALFSSYGNGLSRNMDYFTQHENEENADNFEENIAPDCNIGFTLSGSSSI